MNTESIRKYGKALVVLLLQGSDLLAKAIPSLRLTVERLENAYTDKPTRMARRRLRTAKKRLADRTAKVAGLRNRAKDIRKYCQHYLTSRFNDTKARPHLDLTPYRMPRNGRARGSGPDGTSGILSADGRTGKDKGKAYTTGITAVGYTTDLTYPVNGSSRAIGKATGKAQGRARQVRGPEPTQTGLRLTLISAFFLYRLGEYHRGHLTMTVTHKGKPSTSRKMTRSEYDRDIGYPTTVGKAIDRLRRLKGLEVTVTYEGNAWTLKAPRYSTGQIDGLIKALKAMNEPTRKAWIAYQHTIPGLYGFTALSARVQAHLGKSISITTIRQWEYWNGQVRKVTNPPSPRVKPKGRTKARKGPKPLPAGAKVWTVRRTAGRHPTTGARMYKRAIKSDPTLTHLPSDPMTPTVTLAQMSPSRPRGAYASPSRPRTIGDVPSRVKTARNGCMTVDGRFTKAMRLSPRSTHDTTEMIDGFTADRAIRRAISQGADVTKAVRLEVTKGLR